MERRVLVPGGRDRERKKRLCYYTTKRALLKGTERFMNDRPYTVVDETGMSYRNNPKKK